MSYCSYFPLVDPLSVPIFLSHNTLPPQKSKELTWPLWSCLASGWERCSPLGGEVLSYHLAAASPQTVSSILWLLASQQKGKRPDNTLFGLQVTLELSSSVASF